MLTRDICRIMIYHNHVVWNMWSIRFHSWMIMCSLLPWWCLHTLTMWICLMDMRIHYGSHHHDLYGWDLMIFGYIWTYIMHVKTASDIFTDTCSDEYRYRCFHDMDMMKMRISSPLFAFKKPPGSFKFRCSSLERCSPAAWRSSHSDPEKLLLAFEI